MPAFLFWNEVAIPLAGIFAGLVVALTVVKAIARGVERRHEARMSTGGDRGGEVEGLRTEIGQLRSQVENLEERLDFAERLLTQARSRGQLEQGNRDV